MDALLRRTLVAVGACAGLVVICYFFVDRPVAYFVYRYHLTEFRVLKWLTYPPPIVQMWSPLVLALLLVRRAWGNWPPWQHILFVAFVSLIIADQFRVSLGHVCGRDWPETWFDDNPSLIGSGAYGFHPFETGDGVGSFPSGHAARIVAVVAVCWLAAPRGRWVYAAVSAPILISLIGMDYHFVSDVIAGSVLGGIVGA